MSAPKKPASVSAQLQAWRNLAAEWPSADTCLIHVKATGIERAIPPDCQNENARKALEFAALARQFADSDKGVFFIIEAVAAWKDYMLWDAAMRSVKQGATNAANRTGKTKLTELQKTNIRNEYAAAVVEYGMIKYLSGKYNVSEDTISRILNPPKPK